MGRREREREVYFLGFGVGWWVLFLLGWVYYLSVLISSSFLSTMNFLFYFIFFAIMLLWSITL